MTQESEQAFADLIVYAETCLDAHGADTPRGVGWTHDDGDSRYRVMLELLRNDGQSVSLLDFGCGLSDLNDFIRRQGRTDITYAGLDVSTRYLAASRKRFPDVDYYEIDVLTDRITALPRFDYVVMNGIWLSRVGRSDEEMWGHLKALVRRMFERTRVGLAFTAITPLVDWERDDLWRVPLDPLLHFLATEVSRHVVVRHDYGLYEYAGYVYRRPGDSEQAHSKLLIKDASR